MNRIVVTGRTITQKKNGISLVRKPVGQAEGGTEVGKSHSLFVPGTQTASKGRLSKHQARRLG